MEGRHFPESPRCPQTKFKFKKQSLKHQKENKPNEHVFFPGSPDRKDYLSTPFVDSNRNIWKSLSGASGISL